MTWRKSSHSGGNGGGCIEVGTHADASRILVRDTKNRTGPVLAFPAQTWQKFTRQLKAGAYRR